MSTASRARRAATVAGAAGLVLAAALPASGSTLASGSTAASWSVSQTFGPADGVWSDNFAATSANDAWSTWDSIAGFSVQHWSGSSWSQGAVPSNLESYAESSRAVGASSARNAWLFNQGSVLRWGGSAWRLQKVPSWVVRPNLSGDVEIAPAVFSASSAWVFSLGIDSTTNPDHYAALYSGHSWTKVTLPAIPGQVNAIAPDDIWALGVTTATALKRRPTHVLMHWDGTSWHTVSVPKATDVPPGTSEYVTDLAATGPSDVWLQRDILQGSAGAQTLYLMHWDGTSWTQVSLNFPTSEVDYMAQDGHGGVWMAANGPAPDFTWYFYHLNAGTWTMSSVPAATGLSLLDL